MSTSLPQSPKTTEEMKSINAFSIAEILFIIFPLVIILVVQLYQEGWEEHVHIFYTAEWAFTAVILSGQTIVKLSHLVLLQPKIQFIPGYVALIITICLLMLFVPSLITLIFVLLSEAPSIYLTVIQIVLFSLSVIAFLLPERIR